MTGREIRERFLSFFEERKHRVVESSSLVPADPTLLLTTAGMVQFKPYFLGEEGLPYLRAASVQKCVRTTDIESVGKTTRHSTFFEMLGNFSFGDYYKQLAIPWAWELMTVDLGIQMENLWISVFREDYESAGIWESEAGVDPARIIRLGKEENFWDMGTVGPCGPCSEILYDMGEDKACGPECAPGCDCDRYLELWNLVFMEYHRDEKGELQPLPKKNIDTGMGLERVALVLQGAADIFGTDLFKPLMEAIASLAQVDLENQQSIISSRVVADHLRASGFLIADGVVPSNEGRGYVLRRLIRRAVRHGKILDIEDYFLGELAEVVASYMGDAYPELMENLPLIDGVLRAEEERFGETLNQGLQLLQRVISEQKEGGSVLIDGETAFYLHDTLGFPLELTEEIASQEGVRVDGEKFQVLMEEQRRLGRTARESDEKVKGDYASILDDTGPTEFVGYSQDKCDAGVVALLKDGGSVEEAVDLDDLEVVLDRTPLYAESGGQVGDVGIIEFPGGSFEVVGCYYGAPDLIVHCGRLKGKLSRGIKGRAGIDCERRKAIARNHTATHLLHWALREVLGKHAKQSGSLVDENRLRFDFTHFAPLNDEQKSRIESLANQKVLEDHPVRAFVTTLEYARSIGAIALFGEKYGERVRVLEIDDFSRELCGGTHVGSLGEVGPVKIISESGIGSGLRRIEALSGTGTLDYYRKMEGRISKAAGLLKVEPERVDQRVTELVGEVKSLRQELKKMRSREAVSRVDEILSQGRSVDVEGVPLLLAMVEGEGEDELRRLADAITRVRKSGVVALGSALGETAQVVIKITPDLVERGLDARDLAMAAGKALGGGGGGRKDMAVGGGGQVDGLEEALDRIEEALAGDG